MQLTFAESWFPRRLFALKLFPEASEMSRFCLDLTMLLNDSLLIASDESLP